MEKEREALEAVRIELDEERRSRQRAASSEVRARKLIEVSKTAAALTEIDELFKIVVREASVLFEADMVSLYLSDEDGEFLFSKIVEPTPRAPITIQTRIKANASIAGHVAYTREAKHTRCVS